MCVLLSRFLLAVGMLSAICQPSFAATLSFTAMAQSFNGDFVDNPGTYHASGSIYMPGTGYEMISAGGSVTISADGNTASSSGPNFTSWDALVAAESGQWTLRTNPGLINEMIYFFDVGLGDVDPRPIWVDAYHVAGTPDDQARVDLSGPLDSPYTLFYTANSPSGSVSQLYNLAGDQNFFDLTLPTDITNLFIAASRSTFTSVFSFSTPMTSDGTALADWTLSPHIAYIEGGAFHTNSALRSVSAPDSTSSFLLLLGSILGLTAMRRMRRA